ncbi:hypothetical protein ABIC11_001082 [Pseudomonas oryzihabitans]
MSEDEKQIPERVKRLANFNWEKFLDHADQHGGLNPCEGCGSEDWTATVDEKGKADVLRSPMFNSENSYLIMPVTCGKCGNMRMFNLGMIVNNLGENGEPEDA